MKRWMLIAIFLIAGIAATAGPRLMAAAPCVQMKPAVNPGPNAALLYFRAFLLTPPINYIPKKYLATYPLGTPMDKIIRQLGQSAQASLRLLHRAAELANCRWGIGGDRYGPTVLLPELAKASQLTNWVILEARIAIAEHHFHRAIRDYTDGIMLARAIGRDKTIIGTLVEYSLRERLNWMLADNLTQLPPPALDHLAAALSRLPAPTPISYGIIAENQGKIAWLKRLIRTGRTYQFLKDSVGVSYFLRPGKLYYPAWTALKSILKSKSTSKVYWKKEAYKSICALEHYNKRLRRILALPYPQSISALKKLQPLHPPLTKQLIATGGYVQEIPQPPHHFPLDDVANLLLPSPSNTNGGYAVQCRAIAQTAMLRAAVAYLRGGRKAFDAVKDPFGKGPFMLKKTGKKLVIQSALNVSTIYNKHPSTLTVKLK
jgi:hypothetical protein